MAAGAACVVAACGGRDTRTLPAAPAAPAAPPIRSEPAPEPRTGPLLSEAAARAILGERFRAAGLRVRYDVPVARPGAFALTVDGYDPERGIGFEYVAIPERGTDLDHSERTALARDQDHRILIVDATDAGGLDARITSFLTQDLLTTGSR